MDDKQIRIEITASASKAEKEIAELTKRLGKMDKAITSANKTSTKSFNSTSRSITSLAGHLLKLQGLYGSFHTLSGIVNNTADFDKKLVKLGITAGATSLELQALKDKALEMGAKTEFSAMQALDGLQSLAQQGLSTSDSIEGINAVLNLAAFGMIEIGEAARYASTIMKEWGKTASDLDDITDLLAKGSTIAATSLDEYAMAFIRVSPVAKAYNISMEETAAALDVMADAGRRGAEAGTQLKMVMQRLAANKEASKYMDRYKIYVRDANGELYSFAKQLEIVKKGLEKLPPAQRAIAETEIFGTEAAPSAIALMSHVDNLRIAMEKLKGSMGDDFASKSAASVMDTLRGTLDRVKAAAEGLGLKIGDVLKPKIEEAAEAIIKFIDSIKVSDIKLFGKGISGLVDVVGSLIGTIKAVLTPFYNFVTAFPKLAGAISLATIAVKAFNVVIRMNPIVRALTIALTGASMAYDMFTSSSKRATAELTNAQAKLASMVAKYKAVEDALKSFYVADTDGMKMTAEARKLALDSLQKQLKAVNDNILGLKIDADENAKLSGVLQKTMQLRSNIEAKIKAVTSATIIEAKATRKTTEEYKNSVIEMANLSKAVMRLSDRYSTLVNRATTSLGRLSIKETTLQGELRRLYADRYNIIRKYNNKVDDLNVSYYDNVRKTLGLIQNAERKATSERKAIEDSLHIARKALLNKDLGQATKYYERLIELSDNLTVDSIASDGKIIGSKKRLVTEKLRLSKIAHDGMMKVITAERIAELEKNKAAIQQKLGEIELVKSQIKLTQSYIKTLAQLQEKLTGTKMKIDTKEAKQALIEVDKMSKELKKKLANIQVDIDTAKAKAKLNDLSNDINDTGGTINVDINPDELNESVDTVVDDIDNTDTEIDVNADTTEAETIVNDFIGGVEERDVGLNVSVRTDGVRTDVDDIVGWIDTKDGEITITADTKDAIDEYQRLLSEIDRIKQAELERIRAFTRSKESIDDEYFNKITDINRNIYSTEQLAARQRVQIKREEERAKSAMAAGSYAEAKQHYDNLYRLADQLKIGSVTANGEVIRSEKELAAEKERLAKEAYEGKLKVLNAENEAKKKAHEEELEAKEKELSALEELVDGIKELVDNMDKFREATVKTSDEIDSKIRTNIVSYNDAADAADSYADAINRLADYENRPAWNDPIFDYDGRYIGPGGYMHADGGLVGYATGGAVPGWDAGDSDSVHAIVPKGSYVIRRSSVDHYGHAGIENTLVRLTAGEHVVPPHIVAGVGVETLNMLNAKKFASGGVVDTPPTQQTKSQNTSTGTPVILNIGGRSFETLADADVASKLADYINREIL